VRLITPMTPDFAQDDERRTSKSKGRSRFLAALGMTKGLQTLWMTLKTGNGKSKSMIFPAMSQRRVRMTGVKQAKAMTEADSSLRSE
jgi:hypothetical protein